MNDKKLKSNEELRKNFGVIFLSLNDILLISSEPSVKREFLDRFLIIYSVDYYNNLANYRKTLFNKNKFLYNLKINKNVDYEILEVINDNIVNYSTILSLNRIKVLYEIKKIIYDYLNIFLPNFDFNFVYYISGIERIDLDKFEFDYDKFYIMVRDFYVEYIKRFREKELNYYRSIIGASKDNFEVLVKNRGLYLNVKVVFSFSQVNLFSIAMFLVLKKLMKQVLGYEPILLLDEPFVYLDKNNVFKVISVLRDTSQVIFTTNNSELVHFIFDNFDSINLIKLK